MKLGTKSLLFGAHQFILHPLFVAIAWWRLYGFPWGLKLWVSFIVHDWGYWGLNEMDGPEGNLHPYTGAAIMHWMFDGFDYGSYTRHDSVYNHWRIEDTTWYDFCLCHSRFLAKKIGKEPSRLCMADKLSLAFMPTWLYLFLTKLTGELEVYIESARKGGKHGHMNLTTDNPSVWFNEVKAYLKKYAYEHRDGKPDTVTKLQEEEAV